MRDREVQNKRLDEIGKSMLIASKLPEDEIEKIAASPRLFGAVLARINEEKVPVEVTDGIKAWQWNWRLSVAAYGLLAIFLSAMIVIGIYEKRPVTVVNAPVHKEPDMVVSPYMPDRPIDVKMPDRGNGSIAQHAVFKTRPRTSEHRKPRVEEVSEFYPLTGNLDMNEENGQLVRVNLPRNALASMGIDEVPFETGSSKIKADLLVGSDGVMRAVRFVK